MRSQSITVAAVLTALLSGPALAQGIMTGAPLPSMDTANAEPAAPASPSMSMPSISSAPAQQAAPAPGGTDCTGIQKTLLERKDLVSKANAASSAKQKPTAAQVCAIFGQLQANGVTAIKWITTNKEWCSIPDSFAEGFKADHQKVTGIRTKICGIAAQQGKMEAQAREGGGSSLLGGPGLTGSFKMPQGAL